MGIFEKAGHESQDASDFVDNELIDLYAEMTTVEDWDINKAMHFVRLSYLKGAGDAAASISEALNMEDISQQE